MQYWRKMSSYGLHEIIISNETPSVWFTCGHSMDFMNDRVNLLLLFCFRKVVGCGWQISLTPDAPNWWLPWHKYVMHRSVKFLFFFAPKYWPMDWIEYQYLKKEMACSKSRSDIAPVLLTRHAEKRFLKRQATLGAIARDVNIRLGQRNNFISSQ